MSPQALYLVLTTHSVRAWRGSDRQEVLSTLTIYREAISGKRPKYFWFEVKQNSKSSPRLQACS